jgi:hypothetical protein
VIRSGQKTNHKNEENRMRKRVMFFCAVAAAASLLLWTCGKKSNPAAPPDDGGQTTEAYSYTVVGSTIRVSIPLSVDTSRYCDPLSDTLVTEYDTTAAYIRLYSFSISGTILTLTRVATAVYNRSGTGSDLPGTWIAAGTVDNFPTQMVFTGDSVAFTMAPAVGCYADSEYVRYLWPLDSTDYRLTINRTSCSQVQLTGDSTHETVTMTWNASGDMTVTGSGSGHTAHTWYKKPLSCPNNQYPDWYYSEFLGPNARN